MSLVVVSFSLLVKNGTIISIVIKNTHTVLISYRFKGGSITSYSTLSTESDYLSYNGEVHNILLRLHAHVFYLFKYSRPICFSLLCNNILE